MLYVGICSVYWKSVYCYWTTCWMFSYTTELIRSSSRFVTELSKTIKKDLDLYLCKFCKDIKADYYVYTDVLEGFTKRQSFGHRIEGPSCVMEQNQHTLVIHCKVLAEYITAGRNKRDSWPANVPLKVPKLDTEMHLQGKHFAGTIWWFHWILIFYFRDDGRLVFLSPSVWNMRLHEASQ